jgi:hypothetical protein
MNKQLKYLAKAELQHGLYYHGECRNASIARWCNTHQHFVYRRAKFGNVFLELIKHPEDDEVWDVFYPQGVCTDPNTMEIKLECCNTLN